MIRLAATSLVLGASAALAQPAEPPPADYASDSYTDSKGCHFQRVIFGEETRWAGLVGQDGQPVCDEVPVASETPAEEIAAIPPNRSGERPGFPAAGSYVQVGTFFQRSKADETAAQLQGRGLPVLRQDFRRSGGRFMRVLYVGPLGPGLETQDALSFVRAIGFGDAFVWEVD